MTEREVMRSITESAGIRGTGGVKKRQQKKRIPVAMRLWDTPVLIPNTMVKTFTADGTILETIWESRWLPDLFKNYI